MNNNHSYNVDISNNNRKITHCENFGSSTSSVYEDISPHRHNSNDSCSERQNHSTLSSKKSDTSSDETSDLTIDRLERTLTEDRLAKVDEILAKLASLSDIDKLKIQLKFPVTARDDYDENNCDIGGTCDLGVCTNQNEHSEALTWVISHLEEDRTTCLKKQEVYEDYRSYCLSHNVKYLSTADFGKVMKKAFPHIKARRLGARGQSKYCYSGLKNRNEIKSPILVDVGLSLGHVSECQDKINDIESVLSHCQQPDLSNIPEYELSHNILIDAALVLMDFIKCDGLTKELKSLKQVVEYLLINNRVEASTPYAMRLLPHFLKKRGSTNVESSLCPLGPVDQILRTLKKEETLSDPTNNLSTATNIKRPIVPEKVPSYYEQQKLSNVASFTDQEIFCQPQNNGFNYGLSDNSHLYRSPSMICHMLQSPRPEIMSHVNNRLCQNPFRQNMFSSLAHNSPVKIVSPLLEQNLTTTKKLELSALSTSIYPIIPHKTSKISLYGSPYDFDYDRSIDNENPNDHHRRSSLTCQSKNISLEREGCSPISMTSRNYDNTPYGDLYSCDVDQLERNMPLKRHIGSDFQIDFNPSPRLSHFNVENDSTSSGNLQPSSEDNEYLDTPGNSPTNISTEEDLSEPSSPNNNRPQNFGIELSDTIAVEPSSLSNMVDFMPINIVPLNPCIGAPPMRDMVSYPGTVVKMVTDECNVSSTTMTPGAAYK